MFSWTGFYVGVNGGYGGNSGDLGNNIVDVFAGVITNNIPLVAPNPSGGFGGGQLGYNMQFAPNWLWGVEADFEGSGIRGTSHSSYAGVPGLLNALTLTSSYKTDYFGTVRSRLGYTVDRTMVFITGGFAYGRSLYLTSANFFPVGGPAFNLMKTSTNTGYVVGGGVEQRLTGNWSLKAEYQYINMGSDSITAPYFPPFNTTYFNTVKYDNILQTFRLGLNYKFGS